MDYNLLSREEAYLLFEKELSSLGLEISNIELAQEFNIIPTNFTINIQVDSY